MRVLHVITTATRGGAENHLLALSAAQIRSGKEVAVVYLKGDPNLQSSFENAGVNVISELSNKNFLFQPYLLRKVLKKLKPSIIHSHLPRAELVTSLTFTRIPRVFSRHNTESFYPNSPKVISRIIGKFASRKTLKGIAISAAVKSAILENFEVSQGTTIDIIYYGIEKGKTEIEIDSVAETIIKWKSNHFYTISCVSRLTAQKDIPTLLKAFQLLLVKKPNSKLVVIGSGLLEKELKKLSGTLGIEKEILWVGNVENPQNLVKLTDAFVLSSLYEGFGLVLLEAMLVEVPVIASNNSAIPEVLGAEHEGLFETGNFNELAKKLIQFSELGVQSKVTNYQNRRLEQFSVSRMETETGQVYKKVVSS